MDRSVSLIVLGELSLELRRHQKPEKVDIAWLRKLALNFERRISKNAELRAKYEGTPAKYVPVNRSIMVGRF